MASEKPTAVECPSAGTAPRGWPRRMLNRLEVDRAVFFAIALRVWQLLGGAVSLLLIAQFFSRPLQGYYYTFASLLALQSFFELGLHIVIISAASHEWANLRLGPGGGIEGDSAAVSRLISLGRSIAVWYAAVAMLFTVLVAAAGTLFFSLQPSVAADVQWFWPWNVLVVLSGLLLWTLPLIALLEGCNQVAAVNRFRLAQAVLANLAVWSAIAGGWGLWAAAAATAVRLLCDLYLVGAVYRRFFGTFLQKPLGPRIRWSLDIWPMQWRIGLVGMFSYFEFALFAPVLFHYHGPVLAGQMGMTWTLLAAVQAAALSWVQVRAPRFGMLIFRRDYGQLDRVFARLTAISLAALASASLLAWGFVAALYATGFSLAERLLPPRPTAIFFAAIVLYHLPRCQEIYLRAHKREPTLVVNIIACSLTGLLVWRLGATYGAEGAAWGYLAVVGLFNLPAKTLLWQHCRRQWHP